MSEIPYKGVEQKKGRRQKFKKGRGGQAGSRVDALKRKGEANPLMNYYYFRGIGGLTMIFTLHV